MNRAIESALRRAAKAAVLPAGLASARRPGDLVILLYHRIGDGPGEITLGARTFERHVAFLASRGLATSLSEALSSGTGGVVVSFDDGTADFHELALPILVRHRVPATLYLATGGVGAGSNGGLRWEHLREAVATGLVAVGSHTHGHADLSRADRSTALEEMRRSKELIEDRLGAACRDFAFPWGVASPDAERVARDLFDSVALDAWRINRRGAVDRYRLGRIPVLRSDGRMFFRAKVAGRLNAEAVVYRALGRGPWRPR